MKNAAATAAAIAGPGQLAGVQQSSAADQDQEHEHEHEHEHQTVPSDIALRVKSLEAVLVEKEMVDPAALDAVVDTYENKIGPRNGARVVARAWVDPAYKAGLLSDATEAIAELGYGGAQGEYMVVVENEPRSITSWYARYAPAIPRRRSACHDVHVIDYHG